MAAVRRMDVGDRLTFPVEKWIAARTAACVIGKIYGGRFHVAREPRQGPDVHVERLA